MNKLIETTIAVSPTAKGIRQAITNTLLLLGCLWTTHAEASTLANVVGEIEEITINDPTGTDHWSGGEIVAGGQKIIIPKNMLIDLPANRVTLQQLFVEASASCKAATGGGETGLAKGDACNISGSGGIATIDGTRLDNGNVIAADVFIQKGAESVTGTITYINYTDGYFRINGKTDSTDTGGVMVRINDPDSRHTIQQGLGCAAGSPNCSADPRFTLDGDNYTNVFGTGYPMCIPSTVAARPNAGIAVLNPPLGTITPANATTGADDTLCPQTNRPAPGATVADSRRFAPIKVGDAITAEGNYETVNGVRFLSAHSSMTSDALLTSTAPNQPDYFFLDEVGIDAPGFQNRRARTLFIGFATLAPADVLIWSIHYDPLTNSPHEFPLATVRGCDAAGNVATCTAQGLVGAGANIFKIRHDVDFGVNTKPRWDPCAHLRADGRFPSTICPGSDGTGSNIAEQFAILSPMPHEIQARSGKKLEDMTSGNPPLLHTVDINGNVATNGQYLFPFGVGLGGIGFPEMVEIDLGALATPHSYSGLPWILDRRLGPGGCLDVDNNGIGECEDTIQPLQPFPFEGTFQGVLMDPRKLGGIPPVSYNDTSYTSEPLSDVSNRIVSFVDPNQPARNNGIGVNNEGNFTSNVLTWDANSAPPAATATGGGVIGITPVADLTTGLLCSGSTAFNSPPVAQADTATTSAGTPVTILVLSNDSDANGDTLSVTGISPTAGGASTTSITTTAGNSVSLVVNGVITFTPVGTFPGTDTFFYVISDGQGGTATAKVTVNVNAASNANPVTISGGEVTLEDTPVAVHPLEYATDPNGDTLTVTSVGTPANGTVTLNGSIATYQPRLNFNGTDTFTYIVSDGKGGTATGTVTVTVTPVNDVPVAANDVIDVTAGMTIAAIPVLTNDTDIDGDTLTVSSVTTTTALNALGTVSRNATTGVVSFVAKPNVTGTATFTYAISDGHTGTATATVTVTVKAVVVDVLSFSAQPEFRTTKSELRAAGTGSTDGKTITLRLGTSVTGTIVGTAPVTLGVWSIRVTGISLTGNSQVTAWSNGGGKVTQTLLIRR